MRGKLTALVVTSLAVAVVGCSHVTGSPVAVPSATPTTTSQSPTEAAAAIVKESLQHKLRTDPDLAKLNLAIVDVQLVNKAGNEYKGIATVKTQDGTEHDVPLDVTADGNNVLWETPPGAFLFALRDNPEPPLPPSPPLPASSVPGADAQGFLGGPAVSTRQH